MRWNEAANTACAAKLMQYTATWQRMSLGGADEVTSKFTAHDATSIFDSALGMTFQSLAQ